MYTWGTWLTFHVAHGGFSTISVSYLDNGNILQGYLWINQPDIPNNYSYPGCSDPPGYCLKITQFPPFLWAHGTYKQFFLSSLKNEAKYFPIISPEHNVYLMDTFSSLSHNFLRQDFVGKDGISLFYYVTDSFLRVLVQDTSLVKRSRGKI